MIPKTFFLFFIPTVATDLCVWDLTCVKLRSHTQTKLSES